MLVVATGLEPTLLLRFARSVKFAIGVLLRCRSHDLLLTTLPPRFIRHWRRFGSAPNRCERCALTWWSSLQQNDVAVFNPLKTLISKESADFVLSRRVFAKGCSGGVHDFMNTGCSGCSRGCSRSSVHPVCSLSSRFFLLTRR